MPPPYHFRSIPASRRARQKTPHNRFRLLPHEIPDISADLRIVKRASIPQRREIHHTKKQKGGPIVSTFSICSQGYHTAMRYVFPPGEQEPDTKSTGAMGDHEDAHEGLFVLFVSRMPLVSFASLTVIMIPCSGGAFSLVYLWLSALMPPVLLQAHRPSTLRLNLSPTGAEGGRTIYPLPRRRGRRNSPLPNKTSTTAFFVLSASVMLNSITSLLLPSRSSFQNRLSKI